MAYDPYDILRNIAQPDIAGSIGRGLQVGTALGERIEEKRFNHDYASILAGNGPAGASLVEGDQFQPARDPGLAALEKPRLSKLDQLQMLAAKYPDRAPALQKLIAGEQAKARQAAYQDATARLLSADPSEQPALVRQMQVAFPEEHEALKEAAAGYTEEQKNRNIQAASEVYAAISSGAPDAALGILRTRRSALAKAGESTEITDHLISNLESGDPALVRQSAGIAAKVLSGLMGDKAADAMEKLSGTQRAEDLQPSAVRKAEAEASTAETQAAFAPVERETSVQQQRANIDNIRSTIAERAARLSLDRDKLTSDVQLRLDQMGQITPGAASEVNKFVVSAAEKQGVAEQAGAIADAYAALPAGTGSGSLSGFNEFLKDRFGRQDGLTGLRNQYSALINSQIVKNLPPGSASDTDIALARKGFLTANADRDQIVSFMRGMAKMQELAANAEQGRADWISANGSLGTLRQDSYINGVRVPAGSTYGDFSKSEAATRKKTTPVQPTRSRYGL